MSDCNGKSNDDFKKRFDALEPVADATVNGYRTARKAFDLFAVLQKCKKVDEFVIDDFLKDDGKDILCFAR